MSNKLLLLLILGVVFFSACSDDDDKNSPKDFNGIYSTTSTDRVLDLKYSGAVFIGKSVDFNSTDGKSATLKLQGVVRERVKPYSLVFHWSSAVRFIRSLPRIKMIPGR
ncbi:MAG: hypothetical protein V8R91_01895 [Butyricimonas faecihominis]